MSQLGSSTTLVMIRALAVISALVVGSIASTAFAQGNPNPASLSFDGTDDTQVVCADSDGCFNVSFTIENTAEPSSAPAENVEVTWTVVQGAELVEGPITGTVELGDIAGGESKTAYIQICTKEPLADGQSIKIEFSVTREDSRPEHNLGKRVNVDVVPGSDCPPPIVIPETPIAVLLPLVGAAAVAGGFLVISLRRRRTVDQIA